MKCVPMVLLTLLPALATAQTIYRCQDGNKVTYSDRPCPTGAEKRINTDGGPSPDDVAAARARLQRDLEIRAAADAAERQRRQAEASAAALRSADEAQRARAINPRENEKALTHDETGWDRKTRAQIRAEEQARETGRAPPSTGAAWEKEGVLSHSESGWSRTTRRGQVVDEARHEREARASAAAASRAASTSGGKPPGVITSCDGAGCWDSNGVRYNRGAGPTYFSSDGHTCQAVAPGVPMQCN